MTSTRRLILTSLALALACAGAAHAQGYPRSVQQVLARGRTAAGGTGWNYLRGWHETGREDGAPYERWYDPLRFGMRVEVRRAAGLDVHGFNGAGAWRITPAGAASGTGEPAAVARARTEAFFGVSAYFFSGRFDAAGRYVGARRAGGRSFEVVEIRPWGGLPRELWFERSTGLLARMVDRTGPRSATTEFSDYRKVGPLRVAFRQVADDGGGVRVERTVDSLTFTPADRAKFSLQRNDGG